MNGNPIGALWQILARSFIGVDRACAEAAAYLVEHSSRDVVGELILHDTVGARPINCTVGCVLLFGASWICTGADIAVVDAAIHIKGSGLGGAISPRFRGIWTIINIFV